MALIIEISVRSVFGLNNAEIKKMTKYQDLKNEVKRSWKFKSTKIIPVIIRAMGMMQKNLTELLQTIPRNITANELQLEASYQGLDDDPENVPWNKALRTRKPHSLANES